MTEVRFRAPSNDLIKRIADDIEESDAQEIRSSMDTDDIEDALQLSRDTSFECYVVCSGDTALAIIGIALADPDQGSVGIPWAIMTQSVRKMGREIQRTARSFVSRWSAMFPLLTNVVDERNTRSIHWLESLGFTMGETVHSPRGDPFILFEMRHV